jgi:hypothetical protein
MPAGIASAGPSWCYFCIGGRFKPMTPGSSGLNTSSGFSPDEVSGILSTEIRKGSINSSSFASSVNCSLVSPVRPTSASTFKMRKRAANFLSGHLAGKWVFS